MKYVTYGFVVLLFAMGVPLDSGAQGAQTGRAPLLTDSLVGRDVFVAYCGPCHGLAGTGQGAVAPALRIPPPDLTQLAERNGGTYPEEAVREVLMGPDESSGAHGSTEMPIWGSVFRQLGDTPTVMEVRIGNLVNYLETIQVP